jgi:hypothetical protein
MYFELTAQGVPAPEAFKRAFPNGLPSQYDIQKDLAKDQEKQQWGAILGLPAGVIGGKHLIEKLAPIFGGEAKKALVKEGAKTIGEAVGAATTSTGTQALAPVLTTPAANAAYNAAAMEAGGAPMTLAEITPATEASSAAAAPGAFSLEGFGSAGNAIAPILGAAILGESLLKKRHGTRGAAQGALGGAGIGTYFLPGVGTAIGAGLGGLLGAFGNFGDKNMFKTEHNRLQNLADQGYTGLEPLLEASNFSKGRSMEELIAIEEANKAAGRHSNVQFARSRNEGDLTPEDIVGYSSVIEKAGQGASLADRLELARQALAANAVREHHGTVDVDWAKVGGSPAAPMQPPQAVTPQVAAPSVENQLTPQQSANLTGILQQALKKDKPKSGNWWS